MTASAPETLEVTGGRPLTGAVGVPGDKSISHRALLLSALAEGTSTVTGLSRGDDVVRTRRAVTALGAEVREDGDRVTVAGGRARLAAPAAEIDLGNSGTGMRLLAGVLATLPGTTRITGDASLPRPAHGPGRRPAGPHGGHRGGGGEPLPAAAGGDRR